MPQELVKIAEIAGIGGLALGVFLLLFKRINLPNGTHKHLTLFMWLVWSIALAGMCVYVVDKAINNSGQPEQATIDYFTEGLSITSASNESARDFFNENDGQVVYIHAEIGAHRNSERNHSIVDEYLGEEAFSELISSGEVSGKALPLLADDRDTGFLVLELENQRRLTFSYASMGIIAGIIRGFFEVDITSQGPLAGRRVVYTLREVTASPELRSKFAEVQPEYTTFR